MRAAVAACRLLLLGFCALSSTYALLCTVPFIWYNFIGNARYPAFVGFLLKAEPAMLLGLAVLGAWTLNRDAAGRPRPRLAAAWGIAHGALAVVSLFHPFLVSIDNDSPGTLWAFLWWEPLFSWELLRLFPRGAERPGVRAALPSPASAWSPFAAGAVLCAVYTITHLAASGMPGTVLGSLTAFYWSLSAHLSAAAAAALALMLTRGLALRCAAPGEVFHRMMSVWLFAATFSALRWTALDTIALPAVQATGFAAWAALGLTLSLRALAAEHLPAPRAIGPRSFGAAAVLLLLAPYGFRRALVLDWNLTLQLLSVYAVWGAGGLLAWTALEASAARDALPRRLGEGAATAAAAACLALVWGGYASFTAAAPRLRREGIQTRPAVVRLAEEEPSFRALHHAFFRQTSGEADFFRRLQEATSLPRTTPVRLPELEFSRTSSAAPGKKPDIFIIVIDSLRRDYVGAYNPEVRFTPAIDAFAKDSVLFPRSFTVYGATGLSEPAIWAGGRLPHLQYPHPFHPVNTLQKLVERQGYLPLITMDTILAELLKPALGDTRLDRNTMGTHKLCPTLGELSDRLADLDSSRPVFVYTQPQDIHISVIEREGRDNVTGASYPGFYAPYASRIQRLDACFGRFIQALKKSGRYEDSIIVLTADHGDSLGEGGRWGHAYTVYPEVLTVPIIMRIPPRLRQGRTADPDLMALHIDITPTLYELLGLPVTPPVQAGEGPRLYGRPLFRRAGGPKPQERNSEMVVSSYGPAYGMLLDGGRRLYIGDGVGYQESLFDLVGAAVGGQSVALDPETSQRQRAAVLDWIGALDSQYEIQRQ